MSADAATTSMGVYYSTDYVAEGYGVDTREKSALIATSMSVDPIEGVEIVAPQPATAEQVATVHDRAYVEAVRTGRPARTAIKNGLGEWTPGLARSVFAMTGGVIESAVRSFVHQVNSGSLASGLHHAKFDHGAGFCTFNGLVVAARQVLAMGARNVLILDLDAHAGGGTASLIGGVDGVSQLDIAVAAYDTYGSTENARLTISNGEDYLRDIERALASVGPDEMVDLVIYNAGMDPHESCTTGGAKGITTQVLRTREQMVFGWALDRGWPVSFALAGGYSGPRLSRDELVGLHRMTIQAACPASPVA